MKKVIIILLALTFSHVQSQDLSPETLSLNNSISSLEGRSLRIPVVFSPRTEDLEGLSFTADGQGTEVAVNDDPATIFRIKKRKNFFEPEFYCGNGTPVSHSLNLKDLSIVGTAGALNLASYYVYLNTGKFSDKEQHFATGYIVGSLTTGFAQLVLPKKMKHRKLVSFLIGTGLAFVAGVGKEIKDSDGSGNVEFLDALATSGGGAVGALHISFTDIKKIFNKNSKRKKLLKESFEIETIEELEARLNN